MGLLCWCGLDFSPEQLKAGSSVSLTDYLILHSGFSLLLTLFVVPCVLFCTYSLNMAEKSRCGSGHWHQRSHTLGDKGYKTLCMTILCCISVFSVNTSLFRQFAESYEKIDTNVCKPTASSQLA